MKSIKQEVNFYITMLKLWHWALDEQYECRVELGDIHLQYQPIQAYRTDRDVLQSYYKTNNKMYEKMEKEKAIEDRFKETELILNRCEEILSFIIDPLEREMIKHRFMSSKHNNRKTFATKFNFDIDSVSNKCYWIISKAVKKKRKQLM